MSKGDGFPVGWSNAMLGDVMQIIRGVSYKKDQASSSPGDGLIPILRATNIDRHLYFSELVYVPRSCVSQEQLLKEKDIIIAASSGSRNVVGKAAQLMMPWYGSFGAFCMGLRVSQSMCPEFVGYFLQSDEYRHEVSRLSAGVNINNLRRQHIETLAFRVAPPEEQRRIVAKIEELFSDLDAGVAALERAKANLKRYRAAVLKAAVEGKLTEQWRAANPPKEPASKLLERILKERRKKWEDDQLAAYEASGKSPPKDWRDKYKEPAGLDTSNLPTLPESWCWATVEAVSHVVSGIAFKSRDFTENGIPVVKIANVGYGSFLWKQQEYLPRSFLENNVASRVQPNTLLLALTRPITDNTLKVCVYPADAPIGLLNQRVAMLYPFQGVERPFLFRLMQADYFKREIQTRMSETLQPNLSPNELKEVPVPIPTVEEQVEIVDEVERRLSVVNSIEADLSTNMLRSVRLRQSILKRAFEGKLVPQDPMNEPASAILDRIYQERKAGKASGKEPKLAGRNK